MSTQSRGFTLTRTLNAPRDLVFQAWTDPAHLRWFLNPQSPDTEPIDVDLREGGAFRMRMFISEETDYITGGQYREIVTNERIVFVWGAIGGWPEITDDNPVVTITLSDAGEQTEMQLRVDLPAHLSDTQADEWLNTGMRGGWGQTIDRLVEQLA